MEKVTRKPDRGQHQSLSQCTLQSTLILPDLMFKEMRKSRLDLIQLMALVCKTYSFCFFHHSFDSLC